MHGQALSAPECVQTLLAYFDRQIGQGLERTQAIAVTAEHFHVDCFKVEHFVDERRAAIGEFFSVLPAPAPGLSNAA
jgi:hypothetical protein